MASEETPPARTVGSVTDSFALPTAGTSWAALMHDDEYVPELRWPLSLEVYDRIKHDPRVAGILLAFMGPILKRRAVIIRNGARDDVVQAISEDLGVPVEGDPDDKPRPPMADRFDHPQHMATTLEQTLTYGHYVTYMIGEVETTPRGWWRLKDLEARPAKSIAAFNLDPSGNGKLKSVTQFHNVGGAIMPAEHLAIWIHRKQPGSFVGVPPLRAMHKPYLLKDGSTRITMTNIEKAGGIAYASAPPNAGDKVIRAINSVLSRFRVGSRSAATFPNGTKVDFAKGAGVGEGIDFINLQNEEIAYAAQAMFAGLGQGGSTGNRALGQTLADAFMDQQDAVEQGYAKGMNRVIERIVRWNVGAGEQSPLVAFVQDDSEQLTLEALEALKRLGVTITDEDVEAVRKRYGMVPTPDGVPVQNKPTAAPGQVGGEGSDEPVAASAPFSVRAAGGTGAKPEPHRRALTPREVAAGINFAQMDEQRETALTELLTAWQLIRAEQIDEIRAQIVAAEGDLAELARVAPSPLGTAIMGRVMLTLTEQGIQAAIAEARHQGVTLPEPAMTPLRAAIEAQAASTAQLLATDLGLGASRVATALTIPGGELTPLDVAELVALEVDQRSAAYIEAQLHGMVTCAQAIGRYATWDAAPDGTRYFATELLDGATCSWCREIDETEFADLAALMRAYPTGGYRLCAGRRRCRGAGFARYGDEAPATMNGDEFDVAASFDPHQRRDRQGRWVEFLKGDAARSELSSRHRALTPEQTAAVTRYSDGKDADGNPLPDLPGSSRVNMPLRRLEPLDEDVQEDVNLLDAAIEGQDPLDRDLILWRGIGPNGLDRLRAGGVDDGFTSASTSREHVEANYMREGSQMLLVRIPRGSRVLHMPSVGEGGTLKEEDEVLIGRGTTLRIEHEGADGVVEVTIT